MSQPDASCCLVSKPVSHVYEPVGSLLKGGLEGGVDVYVTGGPSSAGVILATDIFGLTFNQVFQVADRLAEGAGVAVAVPDFFRGNPWSMDRMPPKPEDDLMGWIGQHSYEAVSGIAFSAVELLKKKAGATKFGIYGFCWGASVALQAGQTPTFNCVGGVHPSLFNKSAEFAEAVKVPVILISAKGDPMEDVQAVTDKKDFGTKCVYKRMDDQAHGFCAARGDWSDAAVAAGATLAIDLLISFSKTHLL